MNKFTKAIAAIMLMMVVAVGCNNPKISNNTESNNGFYDSILGLPSGTYALELPATDAVEWKEFLCKDVYLVRQINQAEPVRLIVVDGKIMDVSSFKEIMTEWKFSHYEADIPFLSCRLNIDKSLKINDLDGVMQALADVKIYRYQFAVVPKNADIDIQDYVCLSLHTLRMPARFMGDSIYQKWYDGARDFSNQINVSQIASDTYSINGESVKGVDCKPMLKQLMQQDPNYVIRFKVDDDMLYGDYMVIVTSAFEALNELKDEYAMEKYAKHLNQVFNDEEEKDIHEHFPFRFFEESDDLLR